MNKIITKVIYYLLLIVIVIYTTLIYDFTRIRTIVKYVLRSRYYATRVNTYHDSCKFIIFIL